MSFIATGSVTGFPGPFLANIATNRYDGTPNVAVPGWMDPSLPGGLRIGDSVQIIDYLETGVWEINRCLNRSALAASKQPLLELLATAPSAATAISQTVWFDNSTPDQPHIGFVQTAPPTPPSGGSYVAVPNGSRTWDPGNNWFDSYVRQGSYGNGRNYGLFFYPSMTAALSGVTLKSVTMHVKRADRGGIYGAIQLHAWLHNYAATPPGTAAPTFTAENIPAGGKPSIGAAVDFALPLSFGQALQAGTALGVGFSSDAEADYLLIQPAGFAGDPLNGALTFTWA